MTSDDLRPAPEAVRAELHQIIESANFDASERNRRFLEYIVEETLEGREDRIKAYAVATVVFGRDGSFDAQVDPIVRIEASRLRRSLERYYLMAGTEDTLRIAIPKGGYVPTFEIATPIPADTPPDPRHGVPTAPGPAAPKAPRQSQRLIGAAAILAGLAAVWLAVSWIGGLSLFETQDNDPHATQPGPAVYVAPFEQEGGASQFPSLALGFTREVIVGLTRFSDLNVYGSELAFGDSYEGSVQRLVLEQDIDFIISGDVTVSNDQFAANVVLVDAKTTRFLWTARLEGSLDAADIIELRDVLAKQVTDALAPPYGVIFANKAKESDGKPPEHLSSYECVLRFYQYWRTFDRNEHPLVRACLEKAGITDPSYSEAFAALSLVYSNAYRFKFPVGPVTEDPRGLAMGLAQHAIELAPNAVRGYHALSLAYWLVNDVDKSFDAALSGFALNPNDTELMAELGLRYCWRNQWDKGLPMLREAYKRNPGQPSGYRIAIFMDHYLHQRYREALAETRLIEMPYVLYGHVAVAMASAQLGMQREARAAVERVLAIDPTFGDQLFEHLESRNVHPELIPIIADGLRKAGLHVPEKGGSL